jgi:predicted phage terminase large subunit-like protein
MTDITKDKDALRAIYRTRLGYFCQRSVEELFPGRTYNENWHTRAILYQLLEVRKGNTTRLIINVPPRYYKSTIISVVFVAYLLGRDPTKKIMVVSHSNELAVELSNLTRNLMQSSFYRWVFPDTVISDKKNTETLFKTEQGGGRFAASVGGSVTGFGADLIIADDLQNPNDVLSEIKLKKTNEYLRSTLLSRLENKKKGVMILTHQRLHPEDTTGFALEMGEWVHLKLPAIATEVEKILIGRGEYHIRQPGASLDPGREDEETLKKIEREVGPLVYSAQWQQEPTPPGGRLIKLEDFNRYTELPPLHHCQGYVISLDPAVTAAETSDYSAATVWLVHGIKFYLVEVWRDKFDFPDLEKQCHLLEAKYKPKLFVIENSHIGHALMANAQRANKRHFKTLTPKGDKIERAAAQLGKIANGQVYLPADTSKLEDFIYELKTFPGSKYDDQVDSMVQFLRAMDFRIYGLN